MKRAIVMILAPCRSKKSSALSSRSGVRNTYLPHRSTSRRRRTGHLYPMLSPVMAATNATTPTATTFSLPEPA